MGHGRPSGATAGRGVVDGGSRWRKPGGSSRLRCLLVMACACLAAGGNACRRGGEPARPQAAPPGYMEEIQAERQRKDLLFRTSLDSPLPEAAKASFKGLDYYPVDEAYRFEGKALLHQYPTRMTILGTMGERRPAEKWASFSFELAGRTETLQIYRLLAEPNDPEGHPFIPFADGTSGVETYPAGRYLDPVVDDQGNAVVDFNLAYNPYCAYGRPYDCPVPPPENRLKAPLRAGERGRAGP